VYPEVPARVEYQLTEYGDTLAPIFEELEVWAKSISSGASGSGRLSFRPGGKGRGSTPFILFALPFLCGLTSPPVTFL
jgi:hypothetical protein